MGSKEPGAVRKRDPMDGKHQRSAMVQGRGAELEAMILRAQIGFRLRDLREKGGYLQQDVADEVGIHRSYLSQVENGKRHVPHLILQKLAEKYGVSLDYLVSGVLK